ncbi:hypothetical protein D3C83_163540 [compost metagenome]
MDRVEMVADLAAVAQGDARSAGLELAHVGADGAGVGDHEPDETAEEPGPERERGKPRPEVADPLSG